MKIHAEAVDDVPKAVMAAPKVEYSPDWVPDPRTTLHPLGELVRLARFFRGDADARSKLETRTTRKLKIFILIAKITKITKITTPLKELLEVVLLVSGHSRPEGVSW
jgi:hypothetical protein